MALVADTDNPAQVQIERNLDDAMHVARNVVRDPRLVPGGGACEMAVSRALMQQADSLQVQRPMAWPGVTCPAVVHAAGWASAVASQCNAHQVWST